MNDVTCSMCGNSTQATTAIDKIGETTIKNIPCYECLECGEKYFEESVIEEMEAITGGKICIIDYKAFQKLARNKGLSA